MKSPLSERNVLYIFNLTTDLDSQVLASAHRWIEEFSYQIDYVKVWSTHVGRHSLSANVEVHEIGGGTFLKKVLGAAELLNALLRIQEEKKKAMVFHHMSHHTALILGIPLRILKVPQGLWYSHSKKSPLLRAAYSFVNVIFTSTKAASPIRSKKVKYIGHGIDTKLFFREENKIRTGTVSVGRIAPIKKIESGIEILSKCESPDPTFTLIGPQPDTKYLLDLLETSERLNIQLRVLDGVDQQKLPSILNAYKFYFTGTPESVDKATLEAALCGCIPISDNIAVLELTGMREFWENEEFLIPPAALFQVKYLTKLTSDELIAISQNVSHETQRRNNVTNTCQEIMRSLRKCE
jgi:glycosyltransferase involved in cell wall biosynthesis